MKTLFFIFGLCILLITNMAYSSSHKTTEKKDYSGHFGDMDTNMDDGVDWEEFKNDDYGFSIFYPGNLSIQEFDEGARAKTFIFQDPQT